MEQAIAAFIAAVVDEASDAGPTARPALIEVLEGCPRAFAEWPQRSAGLTSRNLYSLALAMLSGTLSPSAFEAPGEPLQVPRRAVVRLLRHW